MYHMTETRSNVNLGFELLNNQLALYQSCMRMQHYFPTKHPIILKVVKMVRGLNIMVEHIDPQ